MKIELYKDTTARHEGVVVSNMKIDTNKQAKLFHMLSSTLYTNKICSMIRELASNAYDSHKLANKLDTPFEMTSPTLENLEFKIRDYGVGLTEEHALKTILFYLGSDKDESDDFIGGWGIGSKSPFAYAKNYSIICYKDGIKCEFFCWKDDNGLPSFSTVCKEETTEPNGVEIIVPVLSQDMRKFDTEIRNYMFWTNYNIKLDGEVVTRAYNEIKLDDYTIRVFEKPSSMYENNIKVIYGGYGYSISDVIKNTDFAEKYSKLIRNVKSKYYIGILCDSPNALVFNMNREELEVNDKNIAWIRKIILDIFNRYNKIRSALDSGNGFEIGVDEEVKNLVTCQKLINKLKEEIDSQDESFIKLFYDKGDFVTYKWQANVERVMYKSQTPTTFYSSSVPLKDLTEVIVIFWCKKRKYEFNEIKDYDGGVAFANFGKYVSLYIKAQSEDEAITKVKEMEDFRGFDVDKLKFINIPEFKYERPKTVSKPKIWCCARKRYETFSETRTYIIVEKNEVEKYKEQNDLNRGVNGFWTPKAVNAVMLFKKLGLWDVEFSNDFEIISPSKKAIEKIPKENVIYLNKIIDKVEENLEFIIKTYAIPNSREMDKLELTNNKLNNHRSDYDASTKLPYKTLDHLSRMLNRIKTFEEIAYNVKKYVGVVPRHKCKGFIELKKQASLLYYKTTMIERELQYFNILKIERSLRRIKNGEEIKEVTDFLTKFNLTNYFLEQETK